MKRLNKFTIVLAAIALASCNKHTVEPGQDPKPDQGTNAKPAVVDPFLKDIDAGQAGELLKRQQKIVVLDVRTPEEFAEGHIDGAVNIDFNGDGFKEALGKLDKEAHYLMHCRSGGRSTAAKPAFTELGFNYIYHLDGGMLAWEKAGLPTTK